MNKDREPNNSNGFWDKLQDFLYDSIDYIFMILVIVIVGLVINWRLGGLFGDVGLERRDKSEEIEIENKEDLEDKEEVEEEDSKEKDKEEEKEEEKLIKLTIPKGSVSQDVIAILHDHKLIEDKKEFADYIEKKGAEKKLKYGNYEIPSGSDFDEIIEILTK